MAFSLRHKIMSRIRNGLLLLCSSDSDAREFGARTSHASLTATTEGLQTKFQSTLKKLFVSTRLDDFSGTDLMLIDSPLFGCERTVIPVQDPLVNLIVILPSCGWQV